MIDIDKKKKNIIEPVLEIGANQFVGGRINKPTQVTSSSGTTPTQTQTSTDDALSMLYDNSNAKTAQEYLDKANNTPFSYNVYGSDLYNKYKDQYQKNAQLGMEDTMGKAAALTGGYGNSYAQTAGQQAYYREMEGLDDIAMQLYQMAYNQWANDRDYNMQMADYYRGLDQDAFNNALSILKLQGEDEDNKLMDLDRIPEEVMQAVNAAKTNDELNAILTKYGDANVISEKEVKGLLELKSRDESGSKNKEGNPVYANMILDPTAWGVAFNGNKNWTKWWNNKAIDRNAEVISPLGKKLSAQELIRLLKQEDVEGVDARDAVRRLLEALGIND